VGGFRDRSVSKSAGKGRGHPNSHEKTPNPPKRCKTKENTQEPPKQGQTDERIQKIMGKYKILKATSFHVCNVAVAREAYHRSKIVVRSKVTGLNMPRRLHRPMGQRRDCQDRMFTRLGDEYKCVEHDYANPITGFVSVHFQHGHKGVEGVRWHQFEIGVASTLICLGQGN
jgi:hypothetical protein